MAVRARRLGLNTGYDPIRALAAGVVHRAVDDLRQRGLSSYPASSRSLMASQAARWLASDDAASFCGALGIDPDAMNHALNLSAQDDRAYSRLKG